MHQRVQNTLSGYTHEIQGFFRNGWEHIAMTNLFMLKAFSRIAVLILSAYSVHCLINREPLSILLPCLLTLGMHLPLCILLFFKDDRLRWRPRVIHALCVYFYLTLLALIVYMGAVALPDDPGVFFAPFSIVLSIIFILPVWEALSISTATSAVFVLLSHACKAEAEYRQDLALGFITWALILLVGVAILDLRLRDNRLRNELVHLSSTDSLTGLRNRTSAESAARAYLAHFGSLEYSALFVIDLDQFKQINDRLGHQAGDEALRIFSDTLTRLFRAQDIVGRIGGDEFVALMKNTCDPKMVSHRAALICETVRETKLDTYFLSLTCSIGVALCPAHGTTYDTLFQKADEQLYRVKRRGKDGFSLAK